MTLTADQKFKLHKLKQMLKDKGYSGDVYARKWKKFSEQIVNPAKLMIAKANNTKLLGSTPNNDWSKMTGYEKTKALEHGAANLVGGAIAAEMPKNWGEAAADAAMLGAGLVFPPSETAGLIGSTARLLGRVALPALVGGGTSIATGSGDPASVMTKAGIQSIAGEAGAQIYNHLGARSEGNIQYNDVKRFGSWIKKYIPGYSGDLTTNADIFNAFRKANKANMVDELTSKINTSESIIKAWIKDRFFSLPSLSEALMHVGEEPREDDFYTFPEVKEKIKKLNHMAYAYTGDPKANYASKALRPVVHNVLQETGAILDSMAPGTNIGSNWLKMRMQESRALLLRKMLNEKDLKLASGYLRMPELQAQVLNYDKEGYADDLVRNFGQGPTDELQKTVLGGDTPGSAMDVPEKSRLLQHVRVYAHSVSRPPSIGFQPRGFEDKLPRYAGNWPRTRYYPAIPRQARGLMDVLMSPIGHQANKLLNANPVEPVLGEDNAPDAGK